MKKQNEEINLTPEEKGLTVDGIGVAPTEDVIYVLRRLKNKIEIIGDREKDRIIQFQYEKWVNYIDVVIDLVRKDDRGKL